MKRLYLVVGRIFPACRPLPRTARRIIFRKPNIRSWRSDITVERRPIDKQPRALANPTPPVDRTISEQLERLAGRVDKLDWRDAESFCLQKSLIVGSLKRLARSRGYVTK
jgi:hypothetical protein